MFSVLRLVYNNKCRRFEPVDADSKLNDLLIKGSYMPWQIVHEVSQPKYNDQFDQMKPVSMTGFHEFHEAGHALARVYEGQEDRLFDLEGLLKFLKDFDIPKNGWGKKAGMHEARAHAFSILLQEAIDPEYTVTENMRLDLRVMAGACSDVAHGVGSDIAQGLIFKDEINRILEEITPTEALVMWKELCGKLYAHQQTIDMDEMDKNIDGMVVDALYPPQTDDMNEMYKNIDLMATAALLGWKT